MKRPFYMKATPSPSIRLSSVNPYPRILMICGAALIAYGIIAPVGTLLRHVVQSRRDDKLTETASREMAARRESSGTAAITAAVKAHARKASTAKASTAKASTAKASTAKASTAATRSSAELQSQHEIMKLYAKWKNAWPTRDIEDIMQLCSPRVQFRIDTAAPIVGPEDMRDSLDRFVKAGFTVMDTEPPILSITGERATLVARQRYARGPHMSVAAIKNHHFVFQLEGTDKQSRRWRIVKSEFKPYHRSNNIY